MSQVWDLALQTEKPKDEWTNGRTKPNSLDISADASVSNIY